MCLVIANLDGRQIPASYIRAAYRTNHNGFGIMYVKNNELFMQKGMFTCDQVLGLFSKMEAQKTSYVAHFRMATQGSSTTRNAHPFHITNKMKGVAMVHNGVFHDRRLTQTSDDKSDTHLLADWIRFYLENGKLNVNELFVQETPFLKTNFHSDMQSYNKIVFMNGHGQINIMNEHLGTWVDGVWYSNLYSIGGNHAIKFENHVVYEKPCLHDAEKLQKVLNRTLHDNMSVAHVVQTDADNEDDESNSILNLIEDDDDIDAFLEAFGNQISDSEKKKLEEKRRKTARENIERFFFEGVEYDMSGAYGSSDDDTVEIQDETAAALEAAFGDIPEAEDVDEGSSSSELGSEDYWSNTDWESELARYRNSTSQREQKLLTASVASTVRSQQTKSTVMTPSYGTTYVPSKEYEIVELLLRP